MRAAGDIGGIDGEIVHDDEIGHRDMADIVDANVVFDGVTGTDDAIAVRIHRQRR